MSVVERTIFAALAQAQGQMRGPAKDSKNDHFKNRYASLAAFTEAVGGPLAGAGLAYTQGFSQDGSYFCTTIMGPDGQTIETGRIPVPAIPSKAQDLGSLVTYLRRYSLGAALGIAADEDDDGNAASARGNGTKPRRDDPDRERPEIEEAPPVRDRAADLLIELRGELAAALDAAGCQKGDRSADWICQIAAGLTPAQAWQSTAGIQAVLDWMGSYDTPAAARAAALSEEV